jgi:hypothetical protein
MVIKEGTEKTVSRGSLRAMVNVEIVVNSVENGNSGSGVEAFFSLLCT